MRAVDAIPSRRGRQVTAACCSAMSCADRRLRH